MSRLARTTALAVVTALAASTTIARADDDPVTSPEKREANALYKEGVRLYNSDDNAGALDLFQRAYQTFPSPRVEFSLASTLKRMGRTVDAANWYQRFIDDPGAEPQLVNDARTLLVLLDQTVGRVDIFTDGALAEIQIGDGAWQQARGHVLTRVAAGTVVVRGRRPGFVAEATAKVSAGAEQELTLHWTDAHPAKVDVPRPPVHLPPPPPPVRQIAGTSPGHLRRTIALASAGGGVVLAGAALLFQHASSVHVDHERAAANAGNTIGANDEYHRATVDHDLALVSGGVAALAIAAGVTLWVTAPREHAVRVTPLADDHSVGLLFVGRF